MGQNATYTCRFGAMVRDWSQRWHKGTQGLTAASLPFGFVQIMLVLERGHALFGCMYKPPVCFYGRWV